jgi:hypothetical protein
MGLQQESTASPCTLDLTTNNLLLSRCACHVLGQYIPYLNPRAVHTHQNLDSPSLLLMRLIRRFSRSWS